MKDALGKLLEHKSLDSNEVTQVFDFIFTGQATDAQIAGFLVALRMKGETPQEIAAAAQTMRKNATKVRVPEGRLTIDTCGTGGDSRHTFNISTTSAFVAAAAGATVVKHGNRSVSSQCGSADVLTAAGVNIGVDVETVEKCIRELNIGFLFAPALHGAMKHVAGVRKELGMRSIFNIVGPLCNPAGATHQVLGVYSAEHVETIAQTLALLGTTRALVVHGDDGLDELTPCSGTTACLVEHGNVTPLRISPTDVGITTVSIDDLIGGDAQTNADIMRNVLRGKPGAARDAVLLNAGAALWIAEVCDDLPTGADLARKILDSGEALAKLDALVELTNAKAGD